jgi:hypothetical protein
MSQQRLPGFKIIVGDRRNLEEQALIACFENPKSFEHLLRRLTPASNATLALTSAAETPPTAPDIAP